MSSVREFIEKLTKQSKELRMKIEVPKTGGSTLGSSPRPTPLS